MTDERSMFERRFSQFMEGLNKYGRYTSEGLNPNANSLRASLRTTGAVAGLFGDILAYLPEQAIKAITPDSVKEAAKEGIDYLINDTSIGRGIVELAKENPEEAKDVLNAVEITGAIPILGMFGKGGAEATRRVLSGGTARQRVKQGLGGALTGSSFPIMNARNMNTLVRGGMFGDIVDLSKALAGSDAAKRTVGEIVRREGRGPDTGIPFYGPFKVAGGLGEMATALPYTFANMLNPKEVARTRATGLATGARREIKTASNPRGSLVMQTQMRQQAGQPEPPLMKSDSPLMLHSRLIDDVDLFDPKNDKLIRDTMFKDVPDSIATRHLDHIKVVHGQDPNVPTSFAVKPPKSDSVGRESLGLNKTGHFLMRELSMGNLLSNTAKVYGVDKLSPRQLIDVNQIAMGMTKDVTKKIADTVKVKNLKPKNAVNFVVRARAKQASGKSLSKKEQDYLDAWKQAGSPVKTIKDGNGNIISNPNYSKIPDNVDGDTITFTGSYLSSNKELGGVNFVSTIDLNTNKNYVTTSDASDLFGLSGGPKGAPNIIIGVPTQVVDLYSTKTVKGATQRHENWRTRQDRPDVDKKMKEGAVKLEKTTGIKRQPGESPVKYHQRVLNEYDPKVTKEDILYSLGKAAKLSALTTQIDAPLTREDM
tara:strand:- start:3002 stop:4954 length:1953 start_codon:yes stop_codon:yes gene_type:complete